MLATEAQEARDKVGPLEERVGVPTLESEVQKAAAERYKGEVARLEALLTEKDLALNQTQADLAAAQSQVARWHRSSAEHEKRAEGKTCTFYLGLLCTFGLAFLISHFSCPSFQQSQRGRWSRRLLLSRPCRGPLTPRFHTVRPSKPWSHRRARGSG